MEQVKSNTAVAGVDVGKRKLDVAVHGVSEQITVGNTPAGIGEMVDWLRARAVGRVGLEATGGYEKAARLELEAQGFEVVVHQPIEVRLFAKLKRLKAKNDRLDAQLIAAATAQVDALRAAQDPELAKIAERLTAYEQMTAQAAQMKHFLEHVTLDDVRDVLLAQLNELKTLKKKLAAQVVEAISANPPLLARFELLQSIPGCGPISAASLVVRMPELGSMKKGQAASLLGVAPFDRDSGQFKGARHISGGRSRPRAIVYCSALTAKRHDPSFKAFAEHLARAGKPPKLIVVAVMRKFIEAANLVLKRGEPWSENPPGAVEQELAPAS